MSRTGGDKTKQKILAVAERLFSKYGFDATSIDLIAEGAGVNRALIYYHFKDKKALINGLFESILTELSTKIAAERAPHTPSAVMDTAAKIRKEIELVDGRRKILGIMLMEALKEQHGSDALFRCGELAIQSEEGDPDETALTQRDLVFEFFTGFIPLVAFVALRPSFCRYFGCDSQEALDLFTDAFNRSHLHAAASKGSSFPTES